MKNNLKILLSAGILLLTYSVKSQLRISEALCESMENAVGVKLSEISYSWEVKSTEKAVTQHAYQLVISSSELNLKKNKFDVYNTDIVRSNQSIQILYSGKKLKSAQTYYWKVRVWDNYKNLSEWSSIQKFTTGIFTTEDWKLAQWIGYEDMADSNRIVPFIHGKIKLNNAKIIENAVSPLLRKEFKTREEIKSALLFISGLGQYEASINGQRIGSSFLSPGWTNYDKTILYNTYDITNELHKGINSIGVVLGNGFYNLSQERYVKATGAFGKPKMIAVIKIVYKDGKSDYVISDKNWKTFLSPITFNNIYGGENYDARLEQMGWDSSLFNEESWRDVVVVKSPLGKLLPEIDYPVKLMDTFSVKEKTTRNHALVYDFGQNISGIPQIIFKGKSGQKVKIVPAELLNADGEINQADGITPYFYEYTLKGDGEEIWQPKFTYFAVRYVQVEDAVGMNDENPKQMPVIKGLKLLHNRNSSPSNGSFKCSNDLFNRIHSLIDWAVKSNLQSYITDNPQREKLSWQGEQNFMRVAINYNYNVYNLYRSLVQNIKDAQHESGLVPDIAPEFVSFDGPFLDSPEWGTTAFLNIWFLYKYYGDISIIKKTYNMMSRYAGYLQTQATGNMLNYGLGDWLDIGNVTPMGITATAYYYQSINSMSKMAALIGKEKDANMYKKLAQKIKVSFNKKFFNQITKIYGTGSQTAMAMPLSLGLVEDKYKSRVLRNLVTSIKDSNFILTAGDVGHRYLVKALFENGQANTLFKMTNRDDVPGYGYLLKKGATSLVETWDGKSSQNQLAMGHILEWFHGGIAGIAQEPNSVAFKHIKIQPDPVGDITWAKGSYHSPYGWIKTEWTKASDKFSITVEIPVNTTATLYLPAESSSNISVNGKTILNYILKDNLTNINLGSGRYAIIIN